MNIYSWLPFTQQGLAGAASVTVKFCVDFNTFTYTGSPAAYLAKMGGLITGSLATTLQASYTTLGVATRRLPAARARHPRADRHRGPRGGLGFAVSHQRLLPLHR